MELRLPPSVGPGESRGGEGKSLHSYDASMVICVSSQTISSGQKGVEEGPLAETDVE